MLPVQQERQNNRQESRYFTFGYPPSQSSLAQQRCSISGTMRNSTNRRNIPKMQYSFNLIFLFYSPHYIRNLKRKRKISQLPKEISKGWHILGCISLIRSAFKCFPSHIPEPLVNSCHTIFYLFWVFW